MKVEGLIFSLLAVFLFVTGGTYWILSRDPTGFTAIILSGGMAFIIGYYALFTSRRMDARPEDREDAEIAEGAGEVGFFAPYSWWPIAMGFSFSLTTVGMVFGAFLIIIGLACLLASVSGLLFEYYVGVNRTQGYTLSTVDVIGDGATGPGKFLGEKH
ncbi:MAG: cytochrome c oxidase subunit 4 [Actinomycetota bacterium]|nr:cytochrome c oxidase subunit 4 [Actinomycetota bacterium]